MRDRMLVPEIHFDQLYTPFSINDVSERRSGDDDIFIVIRPRDRNFSFRLALELLPPRTFTSDNIREELPENVTVVRLEKLK